MAGAPPRVVVEAPATNEPLAKDATPGSRRRSHLEKLQMVLSAVRVLRQEQQTAELQATVARLANIRTRDTERLVIYSSDTPDIDDFADMVRCQKARYEFDVDGVDRFKHIVADAVAQNEGRLLKSIALACHGPPPDADGEADLPDGPQEIFHWPITKTVTVQDDTDLIDPSHPARQVVDILAGAVELDTGRVDLLACSLLKSREGREVFEAIERETRCNFAASDNATGNPKDGGDWVMESDNIDIRGYYFYETDEFDGSFAAQKMTQSSLDSETLALAQTAAEDMDQFAEDAINMTAKLRYEEEKSQAAEQKEFDELIAERRAAERKARADAVEARMQHEAALKTIEEEHGAALHTMLSAHEAHAKVNADARSKAEAVRKSQEEALCETLRRKEEQAAAEARRLVEAEAAQTARKAEIETLTRQVEAACILGNTALVASDFDGAIAQYRAALEIKGHMKADLTEKILVRISEAEVAKAKHEAAVVTAAKRIHFETVTQVTHVQAHSTLTLERVAPVEHSVSRKVRKLCGGKVERAPIVWLPRKGGMAYSVVLICCRSSLQHIVARWARA